ncbi:MULTISPECIES: anti-sigma factor [unclassified Paraburkholderia]|uniref:anti-sigma factor family protein n=1 Tax=unclassified Paraburkholderia TaxID=2615204 RepID=UPI00160BD1A8|nr:MULTISPECIES: anti-sigma factor [unclassified Paraburkholderia]MBB5445849.1 anti-sigma factor RsiW [Paraburkholderia sp. WSM4177]MBB5486427.1 anti-sigma factor RsiW [Paraburkholderia sp. WSM4180]
MNNDDSDSGLHDELDLRALSAYVDGELPEEQQAAIETQLRQHPQAAARVAAWRAQKAALRALCGVPDSDARQAQAGQGADDRQQAAESGERSYAGSQPTEAEEPAFIVVRRTRPWWQRAGLAACWLAAGAGLALALGPLAPRLTGGAWSGLGGQPAGFAQRADVAYAVYSPERRHPVEVAASEEAHLITWLSKRLNRPLSVPSLQEYGYSLVGGRLLPGEAGPAAQFMYENQAGARLTLYVTGVTRDETAFRLFRDGNRRTFYWISDGMGYALSGAIAEGKLREIAIDVCSALGGKPETWQQ